MNDPGEPRTGRLPPGGTLLTYTDDVTVLALRLRAPATGGGGGWKSA